MSTALADEFPRGRRRYRRHLHRHRPVRRQERPDLARQDTERAGRSQPGLPDRRAAGAGGSRPRRAGARPRAARHDRRHQHDPRGQGGPDRAGDDAGFRHVLAIGRQDIPRRANYLAWVKPPRPVPASRVLEVKERIGAGGTVVEALDEASVQAAADACRRLEGRGGGGLPAALLRQPGARAAGGRDSARQPARRRGDRLVRRAAGGARIRALAGDRAERAGDARRCDLRLAAGRPPGRGEGRGAAALHAVEWRRRRRRHHPARAGADGAVGSGGRRGRRARRGRRLRHPGHHHRRYRRHQRRHLPDQERADRAHPARPCRRLAVAAAHGRHGDHRRGRRLDRQGRRRHADGGPAKRRRRSRPRRLRPRRQRGDGDRRPCRAGPSAGEPAGRTHGARRRGGAPRDRAAGRAAARPRRSRRPRAACSPSSTTT